VTDGYSGTPQSRKLGLGAGVRFDVVNMPNGWQFEEKPDASARITGDTHADIILAFVRSARELESLVDAQAERIRPAGALWIVWPRKAAGHVSDVSDNLIREIVLPRGLVDVKVAAIDENWSGLKVVWRVENR
jgi:hypothetical protein